MLEFFATYRRYSDSLEFMLSSKTIKYGFPQQMSELSQGAQTRFSVVFA